eukprot:jgi/Tetstr1/425727/TSEL_016147.t1
MECPRSDGSEDICREECARHDPGVRTSRNDENHAGCSSQGSRRSTRGEDEADIETCSTCSSDVPLIIPRRQPDGVDENVSVLNDSFAEGEEDENDSLHITTEQELSKLEQELGTGAGWEKHDASGICLHQNFEDDLAILNLLLQEREDIGVDAMECDEDGDFCEDQTLASPLAGNSVISTNTNATSTSTENMVVALVCNLQMHHLACEDDRHKAPSKTAAKQVTSNADTECTQDDILGCVSAGSKTASLSSADAVEEQAVVLTRAQVEEIARCAALEAITLAQKQPHAEPMSPEPSIPKATRGQSIGNSCAASGARSEPESTDEVEEWEFVWESLAGRGQSSQSRVSHPVIPPTTPSGPPRSAWLTSQDAELQKLLACPLEDPSSPATPPLQERPRYSSKAVNCGVVAREHLFPAFDAVLVEEEPEEDAGIIDAFLQESTTITLDGCAREAVPAQEHTPQPGSLSALLSAAFNEEEPEALHSQYCLQPQAAITVNGQSIYELELDRVGNSVDSFRQYLGSLQSRLR